LVLYLVFDLSGFVEGLWLNGRKAAHLIVIAMGVWAGCVGAAVAEPGVGFEQVQPPFPLHSVPSTGLGLMPLGGLAPSASWPVFGEVLATLEPVLDGGARGAASGLSASGLSPWPASVSPAQARLDLLVSLHVAFVSVFLLWGVAHLWSPQAATARLFAMFQAAVWLVGASAFSPWRQALLLAWGPVWLEVAVALASGLALGAFLQFRALYAVHWSGAGGAAVRGAQVSLALLLFLAVSASTDALARAEGIAYGGMGLGWTLGAVWPKLIGGSPWSDPLLLHLPVMAGSTVALWAMGQFLRHQRFTHLDTRRVGAPGPGIRPSPFNVLGVWAPRVRPSAVGRPGGSLSVQRPKSNTVTAQVWRLPSGHDDPVVLIKAACLDLITQGHLQLIVPPHGRPAPLSQVDPYRLLVLIRTLLVETLKHGSPGQTVAVLCEAIPSSNQSGASRSPDVARDERGGRGGRWRLIISHTTTARTWTAPAFVRHSPVRPEMPWPTGSAIFREAYLVAADLGLQLDWETTTAGMRLTLELFKRADDPLR
jgi:hypothetical protein